MNCVHFIVYYDKFISDKMMTEEMESELLKEYPQLPVAWQNEGEIIQSCK